MQLNFTQDAHIDGVRMADDGYLVAMVKVARTGTQKYTGDEMGKPELDVVTLYRPEDQVFNKDSLATFVGRPVTDDHPPEQVTSDNWKKYAHGAIGEGVLRDGEYIRVPITVMDGALIKKIEDGKREISMGYTQNVEFTDGVTPQGEKYQAIASDLRMNHLAIVDRGRAGHECRVGDSADKWGISPLTIDEEETKVTDKLRKVFVDGIQVETTDQGASAIEKLTADNAGLDAKIVSMASEHTEAIAAKDAELAAKDAEIDKLQKTQLSAADLDARVAERSKLISDAESLSNGIDFNGMTDDAVRSAVVVQNYDEATIEGKSQAYIDSRFDVLCEDMKKKNDEEDMEEDGFRKDMRKRDRKKTGDNGQSAYEQRISDSYKTAGAQ